METRWNSSGFQSNRVEAHTGFERFKGAREQREDELRNAGVPPDVLV